MGLVLDRAAILAAPDIEFQEVEVPQWGGSVRIKTMSGVERDEFRTILNSRQKGIDDVSASNATLLAVCLVGDDGQRLFTVDDIETLQRKSASSLDAPVRVAMQLNKLGQEEQDDAVKNSEGDRKDSSGSDSPLPSEKASDSAN
ncbi:MAG: hypothetical protein V4501_08115 [Pseudomonadota bacterium]